MTGMQIVARVCFGIGIWASLCLAVTAVWVIKFDLCKDEQVMSSWVAGMWLTTILTLYLFAAMFWRG